MNQQPATHGNLVVTPDGYYGLMMGEKDADAVGDKFEVFLSNGVTVLCKRDDLKVVPLGPDVDSGAPASFVEILRAKKLADELIEMPARLAQSSSSIAVLRRREIDPHKLFEAEQRVNEMHRRFRQVLKNTFNREALFKLAAMANSAAGSEPTVNIAEVDPSGTSQTTQPAPEWYQGKIPPMPNHPEQKH